MTDLFLLVVDRDGEESRRDSLNSLERNAAEVLPVGRGFLGENAWQEIEVWILAGHKLPPEWNWADIRADRDPKERYYVPFAEWTGHRTEPEGGRKTLALAAAKRYTTIRRRCPEDVANLEARVRDWMDSRQ